MSGTSCKKKPFVVVNLARGVSVYRCMCVTSLILFVITSFGIGLGVGVGYKFGYNDIPLYESILNTSNCHSVQTLSGVNNHTKHTLTVAATSPFKYDIYSDDTQTQFYGFCEIHTYDMNGNTIPLYKPDALFCGAKFAYYIPYHNPYSTLLDNDDTTCFYGQTDKFECAYSDISFSNYWTVRFDLEHINTDIFFTRISLDYISSDRVQVGVAQTIEKYDYGDAMSLGPGVNDVCFQYLVADARWTLCDWHHFVTGFSRLHMNDDLLFIKADSWGTTSLTLFNNSEIVEYEIIALSCMRRSNIKHRKYLFTEICDRISMTDAYKSWILKQDSSFFVLKLSTPDVTNIQMLPHQSMMVTYKGCEYNLKCTKKGCIKELS